MWGNTVWGRGDEGTCQNPVRLSIYDGAMEAVDYIWVNIWCMLQAKLDCWISSQGSKNTRPRENTFSPFGVSNPGFRGGSLLLYYKFHFLFYPTTTAQGWRWTHCSSQPLHKTFFPVPLHPGIQLNQSTWYQPWGVAHLSFSAPWPETHFTCLWLNKKAVSKPCYHLTITQSSALFW